MYHNHREIFTVCFYFTWSALLLSCTDLSPLAGSASQTGNGFIAGMVVSEYGASTHGVAVTLRVSDYDPIAFSRSDTVFSRTTITDDNGRYQFDTVPADTYVIEGSSPATGQKLLRFNAVVHKCDTTILPPDTLKGLGILRVPVNDSLRISGGYLYIPGTSLCDSINSVTIDRGYLEIDSVPAGQLPGIYHATYGDIVQPRLIQDSITVVSGEIVSIAYCDWKFSKKLILNTTASGADVEGNVFDFPVLVRLDGDNFNFNLTGAQGEDLRFTKSDATPLSYEIEEWNTDLQKATIWVKVDTVYGNDSSQYIVIYWGNSNAAAVSNSAAVFDTSGGFAGVWHLGQPSGSNVPDATANGIHGAAMATATVAGAVGMAQSFNGVSSLIRASGSAVDKLNFPENGAFSVSAWVKVNALDSLFHGIVYKSNFQYGLQVKPENQWEFLDYIDKNGWEMSRASASAGSWHAITGLRNGTKQYLYIDGECADSLIVVQSTHFARAYDQPLEIGHCPDGGEDPDRYFNGAIDEVRISKTAYNADWIKLCFMNQKEQDALVKFK